MNVKDSTDRSTSAGDTLYVVKHAERMDYAKFWCGPDRLEHGKLTLIAKVPKTEDDGCDVEVYCTAMPSRFYSVRALGHNPKEAGLVLSTGSGTEMQDLTRQIAKHLSAGMLRVSEWGT